MLSLIVSSFTAESIETKMKLRYSGRVRDKAASAGTSHLADVCHSDQPFRFSLTATALKGKLALGLFELQAHTPSAPQQQRWMCVRAQVYISQVWRPHFSPSGKYLQLADHFQNIFQHRILPQSKVSVFGGFLLLPMTSDMFLELSLINPFVCKGPKNT